MVFFGNPADNKEYSEHVNILNHKVRSLLKESTPALSYIAQKPLNGGLTLVACLVEKSDAHTIRYHQLSDIRYVTIQSASCKELIIGGVLPDDWNAGTFRQAASICKKIGTILGHEGMPLSSIVRQWNYIENITEVSAGLQNYQEFNRARSDFYHSVTWDNGYPASTGIGTTAGGVSVDIEAILCPAPWMINIPVNSDLQVPAHRYSNEVLVGHGNSLSTPKFERARLLGSTGSAYVYVSGTAAIRGEETIAGTDAIGQTRITIENIYHLISAENLKIPGYACNGEPQFEVFIIYLKKESDYSGIKRFMETDFPAISPVYLLADICREELLVEIEAIKVLNFSS